MQPSLFAKSVTYNPLNDKVTTSEIPQQSATYHMPRCLLELQQNDRKHLLRYCIQQPVTDNITHQISYDIFHKSPETNPEFKTSIYSSSVLLSSEQEMLTRM